MANKKFTAIKNDHCLTFDINAEIEEISDDIDIKHQAFSFVLISSICDMPNQKTIDVLGVIVEIGSPNQIMLKSG